MFTNYDGNIFSISNMKMKTIVYFMVYMVTILISEGLVNAKVVTYDFTDDEITGTAVIDTSIPPTNIRDPLSLGESVMYFGAALEIVFSTASGRTVTMTNGNVQVNNDLHSCIARTGGVCIQFHPDGPGDNLSLFFEDNRGDIFEGIQLTAFGQQFLTSVDIPTEPPEGAERIDFFWDFINEEDDIFLSEGSNNIRFVTDNDGIPDNEDDCPLSNLDDSVMIDSCDSGVENPLFMNDEQFGNGCTISDLIGQCAKDVSNHGRFVRCVAHLTSDLKGKGVIIGQEKGAIQSCAAQANIP